jgi:hypothetical protein
MNDEQTGASSTPEELNAAQDAALASNDFAAYEQAENARDQNTALPEVPPASSENTPVPEPGTPDKAIQEKKPKTGEDRKVELRNEIAELLRQRAELQGKTDTGDKAAPPPATVTPPAAAAPATDKTAAPKKPSLNDFATFAEYDAANDAYIADLVTFKASEAIAAAETKRAAAEQQKTLSDAWQSKVAVAKEEHADFADVAFSKDTPITNVMDGFILKSEHGPRILYALGENGSAEGKRIAGLDPYDAVRALIEIEAALPGQKAAAAGSNRIHLVPPVKKHTAAPPPATDLGGHATEPADGAAAALAAGDFTRYEALENAREIKARRG